MAIKSFLLSCLLMGLGTAQHPVLEGTQTQDTPTFTVPAGFSTSTDSALPPEEWRCKFSPEDLIEYYELASRVQKTPVEVVKECLVQSNPPDTPVCELVERFVDFLLPKCTNMPPDYLLSNIFEDVNADSSDSSTVEPASHGSFSLEQRGGDESYHPALKPIYDDCDVLEDPEQHTICVLAELGRALCEQEPWIPLCQDSESGSADEFSSKSNIIDNDLLDEIFDTDGVVLVADDDDLPRRPQVSGAPEATEIARLIEGDPLSNLKRLTQECEHAAGHTSVGHCVYEKMRDQVCSSNPEDELCEVPGPVLVNQHDLPLLHQDH